MAKLVQFGKERLTVGAIVLFSLTFVSLLLLVGLPVYVKLIFTFLLILILTGWAFLFISKKQGCRLIIEDQKRQSDQLESLFKLTSELSKTPFVAEKLSEITTKLTSFFEEYFKANKFILFVKKGKTYQPFLTSNVTLPPSSKLSIKFNSEFLSLLKSKEGINDLSSKEFTQSGKVPSSLRSLQKEQQFDSLISLSTESDLWGFVLLKCGDTSPFPNERIALLMLKQITLNLERQSLSNQLEELEKKFNTDEKQLESDLSVLNRDLKRRIFDLNAVSGLVKNLYSIQEEEGLFSSLARMIQEHLGAKSTLVMLPQKESGEVAGKHFYGVEASN